MTHYKYSCPYCGQHIEYTDGYSGQQMPCPMCQHPIVFPAVAPGKLTSSLRLQRDIPRPKEKFQFSFAAVAKAILGFQHWKIVGMCLIPFAILAGALVASSKIQKTDASPAPTPTQVTVDPEAMTRLTDLASAEQAVKAELAALYSKASTAKLLRQNRASTAAIQKTDQECTAARKAFDAAFAKYQQLGGTINYATQVP